MKYQTQGFMQETSISTLPFNDYSFITVPSIYIHVATSLYDIVNYHILIGFLIIITKHHILGIHGSQYLYVTIILLEQYYAIVIYSTCTIVFQPII